jgi:hypothetical protein
MLIDLSFLGTGFGADDGATLLMAFRGLQAESETQGQIHQVIAKELNNLVAGPFDQWTDGYKVGLLTISTPALVDPFIRRRDLQRSKLMPSMAGSLTTK